MQPIKWGIEYIQGQVKYLPGGLKTPSGVIALIWKKESGYPPELFLAENAGLACNSRLYLFWLNGSAPTAVLLQEKPWRLKEGNISYLQPLAVVKIDALMTGFKRINSP